MKIAVIGTRGIPASYSGVETAVSEISRHLAEKGYEIIIYCWKNNSRPARHLYKNINPVYMPTINSKHFGTLIHAFFSTLHIMFSNADIVHFHALGPSIFSFLPRLTGKKTVVTVHGLDWKRKKWGYFARLFLKLCEYPAVFFPNRTVVISRLLKDYFESKFRKKVYFIPNGTNIRHDHIQKNTPLQEGGYILFAGRLVPEKGVHYLIRAFKELNTDKKLVIAGEPSFTDRYAAYLRRLADKNIEFLGFVPRQDLCRLYMNAYLFVLPSEVEGSSVSLLEAMSYGKCVLVSDIPECLEVIGDCGISFRSGDYTDLRDKLRYLISSPQSVSEIGLRAKKRARQEYNWERIISNIEGLYLSLI